MNILKRILKTRPYVVWHHDSPGVKVVVFRNRLHDLIYPHNEIGSGERGYYNGHHVAIDRTKE